MPIGAISIWEDGATGYDTDDFFLKNREPTGSLNENAFSQLYRNAEERAQEGRKNAENAKKEAMQARSNGNEDQAKVKEEEARVYDAAAFPPEEQLSPKGLALLSYIYVVKDGSEAQPLVADSAKSLEHITRLINNAQAGTQITVIFQPLNMNGYPWPYNKFSSLHKTVIKFEKTENGINVIGMDGVPNATNSELCFQIIERALQKEALENRIPTSPVRFYRLDPHEFGYEGQSGFSRLKSTYECGIYAVKDARQLNRDSKFSQVLNKAKREEGQVIEDVFLYKLPPKYLKSVQSREDQKKIKEKHEQEIVTRKGFTLGQTYQKHGVAYANHFAKKYNTE